MAQTIAVAIRQLWSNLSEISPAPGLMTHISLTPTIHLLFLPLFLAFEIGDILSMLQLINQLGN